MNPFLQTLRQTVIPRNSKREKLARSIQRKLFDLQAIFSSDYPTWIRLNEPAGAALSAQKELVTTLSLQPSFSFLLQISSSPEFLQEQINSILAQTYSKWDLTIILADQPSPAIQRKLESFVKGDSRMSIYFTQAQQSIANRVNSSVTASKAEFIIFLEQGLFLAPFTLFSIVQALNECPNTDFFYSDEDHLAKNGKRFDPFFKPAFNIDYLRSYQYIKRFLVIRKSLGDQLGWIRLEFEKAWEYDLTLRAVERARWVTHIPQVLYHIPSVPSSQQQVSENEKLAEKAALQEHLSRCGLPARIENGPLPGLFQVRYQLTRSPLISIVIPNHEHADDLERCVDSILSMSSYPHFEILIIENNSRGEEIFKLYAQLQNKDKRVRVIGYTQNIFNYSQINNFAVEKAAGDVFLFLNNDTRILNTDWLERMLEYALHTDVGAVGAKLFFSTGLIQHAGIIIGVGLGAGHHFVGAPGDFAGYHYNLLVPQNLSAVTAACLMMRRDVFNEVNGFDERYQLSYGDVDLCLKVRSHGYQIAWSPYAQLVHYESRTRGYEVTQLQEARLNSEANLFMQSWADFLASGDPFYNPNLTLASGNFTLRKAVCPRHARHFRGLLSKGDQ